MSLDFWVGAMFVTGVWLIVWWARDRARYDSASQDD